LSHNIETCMTKSDSWWQHNNLQRWRTEIKKSMSSMTPHKLKMGQNSCNRKSIDIYSWISYARYILLQEM